MSRTVYEETTRLYTSGTTGMPKGVPLNSIVEIFTAHDVIMHCPLSPEDRTLNMTPWFHRGGLYVGGPLTMARRNGMARTCTVCRHPDVAAIDRALVAVQPVRVIASRYVTMSHMAVQCYKAEHLPPELAKATDAEDVGHAIDVVKQLKAINGVALEIMAKARERGDGDTALKATRELLDLEINLDESRLPALYPLALLPFDVCAVAGCFLRVDCPQ